MRLVWNDYKKVKVLPRIDGSWVHLAILDLFSTIEKYEISPKVVSEILFYTSRQLKIFFYNSYVYFGQ